MATNAVYFDVHYTTISHGVKRYEGKVYICRNARIDPYVPSNLFTDTINAIIGIDLCTMQG